MELKDFWKAIDRGIYPEDRSTQGAITVSYDYNPLTDDIMTLVISVRDLNDNVKVIRTLHGKEALELYQTLTRTE